MVERIPKSTAQDDALVAIGQLGKLFVVILGVVFTDGKDAERDHRLAKRSSESVKHTNGFPEAKQQQEWSKSPSKQPTVGTSSVWVSSTSHNQKVKAKATERGNRAGRGQRRPTQDGNWSFEQVASRPELRNFFTPKNVNHGVCFKFQSRRCKDSNCPREHCCIGCGGSVRRVPLPPRSY